MLSNIQSYILHHNLCNSGTPVLVACSGGVDSMVLVDVLLKMNYKIGLAHCNFRLRGDESDADETFVRQYATEKNIPFFSIPFDTNEFKKEQHISTQMAARELRYDWFEKIRKTNGYHFIATAHHLGDQLETVLLNFTKCTGIRGLTGMQPKYGNVIRPLLEISREEIVNFAVENKIAFREDASNATDDYQRNAIRHQVIPQLEKINPSLHGSVKEFLSRMNDYAVLSTEQLAAIKKKCYSEKNGIAEIKMGFITTHKAGKTILFHLLEEFNFNNSQVAQLFQSFKALEKLTASGAQFFSDTHRLVADRNSVFIVRVEIERTDHLFFDKIPHQIIFNNYKIECSVVPVHEVHIKTSPRFAYFDLDKMSMPLKVRSYKEGDYFYPFGMSKPKTPGKVGKKKLSKYFKDEKFSLLDKENTPVLFSGEKLVWLMGHRTDDRFKITPATKNVLKMVISDEKNNT